MDHAVDRVQELGDAVGRDQAREDEGMSDAQAFGLGDQAVAENPVADEDEADPGVGPEHVGGREQDVVVPLPLE